MTKALKVPKNTVKKAAKFGYSTVRSFYYVYEKVNFPVYARLSDDEKDYFVRVATDLFTNKATGVVGPTTPVPTVTPEAGILGRWANPSGPNDADALATKLFCDVVTAVV